MRSGAAEHRTDVAADGGRARLVVAVSTVPDEVGADAAALGVGFGAAFLGFGVLVTAVEAGLFSRFIGVPVAVALVLLLPVRSSALRRNPGRVAWTGFAWVLIGLPGPLWLLVGLGPAALAAPAGFAALAGAGVGAWQRRRWYRPRP